MPVSFAHRCRVLHHLARTEAGARGLLPRAPAKPIARSAVSTMTDALCPRCAIRYLPVVGACICTMTFAQQIGHS